MSAPYKLTIDKWALDVECLNQVESRARVSFEIVDTEARLLAAKASRDLLYAQLKQMAQTEPEAFGLSGRPTVDALRDAVECDAEYQARCRAYDEVAHELATLKAVDRTLDDRRRMLEHLVTLHGRDYWASPRVSNADIAKVTDANIAAVPQTVERRRRTR